MLITKSKPQQLTIRFINLKKSSKPIISIIETTKIAYLITKHTSKKTIIVNNNIKIKLYLPIIKQYDFK